IWLTVLFAGVLSFNRSYEQELENGALDMLLLYPGDRRSIFIGKLIANLAFVLLVEMILLPTAALLYDLPIARFVVPLGAVIALGRLCAAMASRVRAREVLLPLLLFPMLIPLLVAAVEATGAVLAGDAMGDAGAWMRLLVVFDVVFLVAAFLAFEYVIEG